MTNVIQAITTLPSVLVNNKINTLVGGAVAVALYQAARAWQTNAQFEKLSPPEYYHHTQLYTCWPQLKNLRAKENACGEEVAQLFWGTDETMWSESPQLKAMKEQADQVEQCGPLINQFLDQLAKNMQVLQKQTAESLEIIYRKDLEEQLEFWSQDTEIIKHPYLLSLNGNKEEIEKKEGFHLSEEAFKKSDLFSTQVKLKKEKHSTVEQTQIEKWVLEDWEDRKNHLSMNYQAQLKQIDNIVGAKEEQIQQLHQSLKNIKTNVQYCVEQPEAVVQKWQNEKDLFSQQACKLLASLAKIKKEVFEIFKNQPTDLDISGWLNSIEQLDESLNASELVKPLKQLEPTLQKYQESCSQPISKEMFRELEQLYLLAENSHRLIQSKKRAIAYTGASLLGIGYFLIRSFK